MNEPETRTNPTADEDLTAAAETAAERRCRSCGCSDEDCLRCILRTGAPCSWIDPTLCSACA